MKEWTQKEMDELFVKIQKKAATDADFRKEILEDATAAVEKLAGEKLPSGYTLKAVEQDPNYSATFVIPDVISEELSEGEMKKLAGGTGNPGFGIGILLVCAANLDIPNSAVAGICPSDTQCAAHGCRAYA